MRDLSVEGSRFAVRSSAVDEDGSQHSFAGQFDTFLFVDRNGISSKIAAVWRSGFSDRILEYRRQHGLSSATFAAPAVLVQKMVTATVSGVAFSADPVSGRRSIAVVSAVPGLGRRSLAAKLPRMSSRSIALGQSLIERLCARTFPIVLIPPPPKVSPPSLCPTLKDQSPRSPMYKRSL